MDSFETDARTKGFHAVAGVDEAGRGPLAGPVTAAAVIFTSVPTRLGIKDSKTLSPKKRASLVFDIYRHAASVGVGFVWPAEIDRINILRASLKAMVKAVEGLSVRPELLLIDGNFPVDSEIEQKLIVSGDSLSVSIAAASIIAKTIRDRVMESYGLLYPRYNFAQNKGYPTKEHLEALERFGPSPIHRLSFRGVLKKESTEPL
ncbi:MAG: ribonuclease HII [Deltaproteobacteria bacterium]|nr:ribonuclease HII [Deltaproteobacteria bacterium]